MQGRSRFEVSLMEVQRRQIDAFFPECVGDWVRAAPARCRCVALEPCVPLC